MKALIFSLPLIVFASLSHAQEVTISSKELANSFEKITIFDGRTLDVSTDLEEAYIQDNTLEAFQTKTGEVLNRTDVISIQFKNFSTLKIFAADKGVDGGG